MALLIIKRISASSLIEVIVAMLITIVIFTITIQLFNQILSAGNTLLRIKMRKRLDELYLESVKNKAYIDKTLIEDNVVIQIKAMPFRQNRDLISLELSAKDSITRINEVRRHLVIREP